MLESKYNPFIACFLHNCEEYLFSRDYHLLYPVPFGNYEVAEYFDTEKTRSFYKLMNDYINKHGLKIMEKKLINAYNYTHVYEYVFTFDKKYYKVPLEDYTYYGWETAPDWLEKDLDKYQAHQKTITKVIYE